MNLTLSALQQLGAEAHVIQHRAALPMVDGQRVCHQLCGTVEKLREKRLVIKLDRPKLNPLAVWNRFAASSFDLTTLDALELRTLCSAEETALRPKFVNALSQSPERLKRSRCLYGMVMNYFSAWRKMKEPSTVESLLSSVFVSYAGKNPVVQKWLMCPSLFSERASAFLADEISSEQKTVDEVLHRYYVGPLTQLGRSVRNSAATSACEFLHRVESTRDDEWSLHFLRWMTEGVLSDLTAADAFANALSSLILSQSAKKSEGFQRALRTYVQNHRRLGDPRARESSLNWRPIAPAAAQRYLSWLARDSIIFFFNTILPNNSENRRRKDFWLRYHDHIKDFQVAVSGNDIWKLKASKNSSDFQHYSEVINATTSAFLMRFEGYGKNYLIVEFSEKGNAAYVYNMADFEARGLSLRTQRFRLTSDLKFDRAHRILHMGDWERETAAKMACDLGIRP